MRRFKITIENGLRRKARSVFMKYLSKAHLSTSETDFACIAPGNHVFRCETYCLNHLSSIRSVDQILSRSEFTVDDGDAKSWPKHPKSVPTSDEIYEGLLDTCSMSICCHIYTYISLSAGTYETVTKAVITAVGSYRPWNHMSTRQ